MALGRRGGALAPAVGDGVGVCSERRAHAAAGEIPEGPIAGPWEVGRGTPNGYGLFDAGTIVHEWCLNWHEPDSSLSASPRGSPARRASRGGSWRHRIRWSSPSARTSLPPGYRYSDYGFRVLRELDR